MHYVYLLQSEATPTHRYIGETADLQSRLAKHNEGGVPQTAPHRPWLLRTYIAFAHRDQALEFEAYLKSGSGRAFANKHLWPNTRPGK